jgi:Fe-Mn family superoxide dismutase
MSTYTLPDLSYDYGALEPAINGEILELHHGKHHAAYVKGANDALDALAEAGSAGSFGALVGLEKTLAFNLSGRILHSLYWQNLSPNGGGTPTGSLLAAIEADFGSFPAFKDHLCAATTSLQGSGWGVLAWEPLGRKLMVTQIYDHHANVGVGSTPLLALDAWEHAYYLQYRNVRADYVAKIWDVIDWTDVAARCAQACESRP